MKKAISIIAVLALLLSLALPVFAENGVPADVQQAIGSSLAAESASDNSTALQQANDDKITGADLKNFKQGFSELLTQLKQLRTECSDLWNQIRSTNQNIKTGLNGIKEAVKGLDKGARKTALESLKASLEPIQTQVKAAQSDIKALRAQKQAEWVNFRTAVKAGDESSASSALNSIISLKSQIIEKQKSLLDLKQQILAVLQAPLAAQNQNSGDAPVSEL